MAEELGALAVKIAIDNTGFQQGVTGINKSLKVLDSEFKLNTSNIGLNGTAMDKLKVKFDSLGKTMELQKQKITALESAYQKSVTAKGKDAKASQDLEIKLNNAKTTLNKMGNELTIVNGKMEQSTTKTGLFAKAQEKLHLSLANLKEGFGVVGIAVGAYLKGAVVSATSAEKSTKQLTNTLVNQGMSASDAKKNIASFTDGITKMSDYSKGEAKSALMALAEKGISAGNALKAEGTIANTAAGMNTDLVSAANLVADAYHGKGKALVSLGILSKAEVKNMGNSEKAGISMAEVQNRLNKRFAGSAQTDMNSYDGKLKTMTNSMNGMKTQIGTALLPILTQLVTGLAKIITPIADFVSKNPGFTAGILAVVAVVGTLVGGLSVLSTVLGIFGVTLSVSILPTVGLVLLAITALGVIAFEVVKHWTPISAFFSNLWKGTKTVFSNFWTWLKGFMAQWGTVILAVLMPFIGIPLLIFQHWGAIKDFFTKLFSEVGNKLKSWGNDTKEFMSKWGEIIKSKAISAWNGLINGVLNICNNIKSGIINIFNAIINWFKQLPSQLLTVGKNMFTSMKNGIMSVIGNIKTTIANGITGAIDWIKSLPSQAIQWGSDMIQGLIDGISSMIGNVTSAVSGIADTITSFLHFSTPDEGSLSHYGDWMPDMMEGLSKGITANKYKVVNAIKGLTSDMTIGVKASGGIDSSTLAGTKSVTNNYGSLLHVDNMSMANGMSIQAVAEQLGFYMKQQDLGMGGNN